MKTRKRNINGHKITAFKDPSTISGEWVVNSKNFHDRFNARKFTMRDSMKALSELEVIRDKLEV